MPGNSRQLTAAAEQEYPVRVRIAADGAFGSALNKIHAWLDENCGADSWKTAPAGMRGIGMMPPCFIFATPHLPPPLSRAGARAAAICPSGVGRS